MNNIPIVKNVAMNSNMHVKLCCAQQMEAAGKVMKSVRKLMDYIWWVQTRHKFLTHLGGRCLGERKEIKANKESTHICQRPKQIRWNSSISSFLTTRSGSIKHWMSLSRACVGWVAMPTKSLVTPWRLHIGYNFWCCQRICSFWSSCSCRLTTLVVQALS